jgi:TPR repeat protein
MVLNLIAGLAIDLSATYAWLRLCDRSVTRGQEAHVRESPTSRITDLRTGPRRIERYAWHYRAALLAALVTLAPLAAAQEDYEAGKRAYLTGNYAEALRIWQPLADDGNKFAQFSLGSLYFEGAGVDPGMEESARMEVSAKWFKLAAEQGYAPAQFNLGNAYKNGNGIEQNDLKAAEWWRKSAEQDFAPAQFNLATQYYFGRGVPKDEETAIRWYRRAAENGHAQAQRLFSMTDSPANQVQASTPAPAADTPTPSTGSAAPAVAAAATAGAAASTPPASPSSPSASAAADGATSESWLLAQNPDDYTLQLLATHDENLMRTYLEKHRFTEPVAYFAFQRDGKQWYAAVYGAFSAKSQAQNAVATLPPEVGKNPPWIRQFGGIHRLIKTP